MKFPGPHPAGSIPAGIVRTARFTTDLWNTGRFVLYALPEVQLSVSPEIGRSSAVNLFSLRIGVCG